MDCTYYRRMFETLVYHRTNFSFVASFLIILRIHLTAKFLLGIFKKSLLSKLLTDVVEKKKRITLSLPSCTNQILRMCSPIRFLADRIFLRSRLSLNYFDRCIYLQSELDENLYIKIAKTSFISMKFSL